MRMVTLLLGLVAIAAGAPGASAEDRLTPMLRMVPQDAVAGGVNALVTFTDLTALRAAGLAGVPLFERFAWEPVDKELAALSRASALPAILTDYINYLGIHRFETTEDYLGFAWTDIELAVGYGAPPGAVTILQGTPALTDPAAIDAALTARGFAAESRGGHDFWWRLEDNALDIPNLDPADPLRGHLGGSARAGIVDGFFVAAANWQSIDNVLRTSDPGATTLAGSADFTAMAYAFDQAVTAEGTLLQAYLMAGAFDITSAIESMMLGNPSNEEIAALHLQLSGGDNSAHTPRYRAIGIADRQEGEQAVGLVALVYDRQADAELAVERVPQAVATLDSAVVDRPYRDLLPFDLSTSIVEAPDGSRHVAVIAFSTTLPPRTGPGERQLLPFTRLVDLMLRRDMGPFVAADR